MVDWSAVNWPAAGFVMNVIWFAYFMANQRWTRHRITAMQDQLREQASQEPYVSAALRRHYASEGIFVAEELVDRAHREFIYAKAYGTDWKRQFERGLRGEFPGKDVLE